MGDQAAVNRLDDEPVSIGGPSRTRTLAPLIKSPDREQTTETHDDLSAGNSDDHD